MSIVLIADDDADHRELLALALRRGGHEVVEAQDAAEAMIALAGGGFDAALLDVRMPGESGIDLTRRLRAEPVTALLPVMLISADVNDRCVLEALAAGADDYMTKPFHRTELCARIDNMVLNKPAAVSQPAAVAGAAAAAGRAAALAVRGRAPVAPHEVIRLIRTEARSA
jgi:DNA-binding response OmpR family regulator